MMRRTATGCGCVPCVAAFAAVLACYGMLTCYQELVFARRGKEEVLKKFSMAVSGSSPRSGSVIMYNRVPKTGSTTLTHLMAQSSPALHAIHANFSRAAHLLSLQDQLDFVTNISEWTLVHPALVHGHFPYIDFKRLGSSISPLYINVVRDPIERLVSLYYFRRYGGTFHGDRRRHYKDTTTFDECVGRGLAECSPGALWFQIPFFCGNYNYCSEKGSRAALERAKRRVEEDYLIVGTTERMEDLVQVLEALLPRFFSGMTHLYRSGQDHLRKTKHKDAISRTTRAVLENSTEYRMEMELYRLVESNFRFHADRILHRKEHRYTFDLIKGPIVNGHRLPAASQLPNAISTTSDSD